MDGYLRLRQVCLVAPELEYHLTDSAASMLIGFEGMHAEAAKACETTGVPSTERDFSATGNARSCSLVGSRGRSRGAW